MPLKETDYGGQHSMDKNPTAVFWARFCCCRNWIMIKCTDITSGCMGRRRLAFSQWMASVRWSAQDATQWFASQSTTWSIRPDDALERWGGWARRTSSICWAHCDHEMQFCASSLKASLKYLDVSCPYNDAPKLSIMAVVAYGLTQQCFSYSVWLRETADSSHRVSLRSQLQNASGLRMIINILCSSLMRPAHWAVLNALLGTCVSLCNLFT